MCPARKMQQARAAGMPHAKQIADRTIFAAVSEAVERGRGDRPSFLFPVRATGGMITTAQLMQALQAQLEGTPRFLVAAEVRPGGKAEVEVDRVEGSITLDELTAINKGLREHFGDALDDLELQVGSPGLGRPFKVQQQYRKHIGQGVEVAMADGTLLHGTLEGFDGAGITLRLLQPAKVKGRMPKLAEETTAIPFTAIKSTQATIKLN